MKRGYCFDIVRQVQHSPVMILYSLSTILDQQLEQEETRIIQCVCNYKPLDLVTLR